MWLEWAWEGFVSGVIKVVALWWLVPLFILIQLLKDSGWLTKVSSKLKPALAPFGVSGEAGLPVVAGLAVGLTYGAGVILQTAEEGKLSRNELTVTCVFLGICHAVVEETILFTAMGANGLILVSIRFLVALVLTFVTSRILLKPLHA